MLGTALLARATRPGRGALANASEAAAGLWLAVADRLLLTGELDVDTEPGPGELHAMSREECDALLVECRLGRFAYAPRVGVPDIVPVNYVLDGRDILIRSGPGPKLQAAERGDLVAFEVDQVDPATQTGRSVVVLGRASRLRPEEQQKVEDKTAGTPWALGPRRHVIRIRPTRVTGRRLT
jgi:hypothetical protein